MEFDQVPAAGDGVGRSRSTEKFANADLAERRRFVFRTILAGGDLYGNVARLEGGDLILVRIFGIGFVSGTVDEMQIQRISTLAGQHACVGQADPRGGGVR